MVYGVVTLLISVQSGSLSVLYSMFHVSSFPPAVHDIVAVVMATSSTVTSVGLSQSGIKSMLTLSIKIAPEL